MESNPIVGWGMFFIEMGISVSAVFCPFFVFPTKRPKYTYPIVYSMAVSLLFAIDITLGFFDKGSALRKLVFFVVCTFEILIYVGINYYLSKGNLWRNIFITFLFVQLSTTCAPILFSLSPEANRAYNTYLIDGVSPSLQGGFLCFCLYSVSTVIFGIVFYFLVPRGASRSRIWSVLCLIYVLIAMISGSARNVYYDMLATGKVSNETLGRLFGHVFIVIALVSLGVLATYFYNRMECQRIRREQQLLEDVLNENVGIRMSENTCDRHTGNLLIDCELQRLSDWAEENKIAGEYALKGSCKDTMCVSNVELVSLLRASAGIVKRLHARTLPWMVCRVRMNEEMLLLCLEFNHRSTFGRPLRNMEEMQDIYDIMSLHDGVMKVKRYPNLYRLELMLFANRHSKHEA